MGLSVGAVGVEQVNGAGILRRATAQDAPVIGQLVRELGWTLRGRPKRWVGILAIGLWVGWTVAVGAIGIAIVGLLLIALVRLALFQYPLVSWTEYWVITVGTQVVACAKLYEGELTSEIYDVFVVREWRGIGFGQALVKRLMQEARYPVYLASLPNAIGFYETLGFRVVQPRSLSPTLQSRLSLTNPSYQKLGLTPMRWDNRA